MKTRAEFARTIAEHDLSHTDRAVAFLWYYRNSQEYDERSASDLATDLHDEDFPKPNVTRLAQDLRRSRFTNRGKRPGTFQIDVRRLPQLDKVYGPLLGVKQVEVTGAVLDPLAVAGTRTYLEKLVHQINGAYEYGFFDACAVLSRRLMESLLIEIYISRNRHQEIRENGVFLPLNRLLAHIAADRTIALSRGTTQTMDEVKQIGDTAAHDRTYITQQLDIDHSKLRYRKLISELLNLAGIRK